LIGITIAHVALKDSYCIAGNKCFTKDPNKKPIYNERWVFNDWSL